MNVTTAHNEENIRSNLRIKLKLSYGCLLRLNRVLTSCVNFGIKFHKFIEISNVLIKKKIIFKLSITFRRPSFLPNISNSNCINALPMNCSLLTCYHGRLSLQIPDINHIFNLFMFIVTRKIKI